MAYIITETCTKDEHCIETCPVNCIHPTKDEADFLTVHLPKTAETTGLIDADLLLPEDGQRLLAALDDTLAVAIGKSTNRRRGPRAAYPGTERNRK